MPIHPEDSPTAEPADRSARRRHTPMAPLVENVAESATACLVTMVQGNLLAVTVGHWLIASRTGVISGIVATAALWLAGDSRRWLAATVLAAVTFGIDLFSHPSHFGGALTEAVVTGAAAGALSIAVGKLRSRRPRA